MIFCLKLGNKNSNMLQDLVLEMWVIRKKCLRNPCFASELHWTAGPALHRESRDGKGETEEVCLSYWGMRAVKKGCKNWGDPSGKKIQPITYGDCGWIGCFVSLLRGGLENSWENPSSWRRGRNEVPFRENVRPCRIRKLHSLALEILYRNTWHCWKVWTVRLSEEAQEAVMVIGKE